jgi:hypothetical protein
VAKRFTDTNKYKKPFLRGLQGAYKLLWDFLYHDCDHAGIWIVDFEIAQVYLGADMPVNKKDALKFFNTEDETRVIELDGGKRWFIPSFIEFQYGNLSEKNKAHSNIILVLKRYGLLDENLKITEKKNKPLSSTFKAPSEEHICPLQGDKEMVKEKEMEKEMEKDFGKSENLLSPIIPQMCDLWYASFSTYTKDRDSDFSGMGKILQFMVKQANVSIIESDSKAKILNTLQLIADQVNRETFWVNKPIKSIANNIQEFYNHIKNPVVNGKSKKSNNGDNLKHRVASGFDSRFGSG